MANPNKPFGFVPLQSEGKENRCRVYNKDTSAAIYPGDPVKLNGSGAAVIATSGDTLLGVAAAYEAAASGTIKVYDDPDQDFIAQCDGDFQLASIGDNANAVFAAGDATLKASKCSLNHTFADTSTFQFKIFGLYVRGNNAVGSYAIMRVKPNNHLYNVGVTGD